MENWLDPVYDAAGMAAADRWTIDVAGVDSLELMEAAGRGLARAAADLAEHGPITVVCGKGNNGGDGLVAARHLADAGFDVRVFLLGEREELSPDAQANFDRLPTELLTLKVGPIKEQLEGVLIDALLGTGFVGEPREPVKSAIERINASGLPVVACDVPSGIDASTGAAAETVVNAARTVTFHRRKLGHLINPGKRLRGPLEVVPIGIPSGAPPPAAGGVIRPDVLELLPRRGAESNKFTSGRVSIVGGSRGLTGAVCLAAEASIRAGAGYATAAVPGSLEDIFEIKLTEVMSKGFGAGATLSGEELDQVLGFLQGASAVVLGSGIGREQGTRDLVAGLVEKVESPLVVDADALSLIGDCDQPFVGRQGRLILTPHEGEAARLLGCESAEVSARRLESAQTLARQSGAVVVLKGDDTIVTDGGRVAVNNLASPALATAGTGDVLAGIVGAFVARGLDSFEAAAAAAFAHAFAGEFAAREIGNRDGVIATDVIREIPRAMIPPAG